MHGIERGQNTQRVAADVTGNDAVQIPEQLKGLPVGTARAECRRASRSCGGFRFGIVGKELFHAGNAQFAKLKDLRFRHHIHAEETNIFFQETGPFFHHHDFLHGRSKIFDQFCRQRPGHTQFQHLRFRGSFQRMIVRHAGRDDPQFRFRRTIDPVQTFADIVPCGKIVHLLHQTDMRRFCVGGDHDPFFHVGREGGNSRLLRRFPAVHDPAGVADTGGHAQQHGLMEFFGDLVGTDRKVIGFLTVGGFQHGHLGELRIVAVVLFVLTGRHSGVVSGDQDHAAGHTGVSEGKKRVRRHIHAHMLHGHDTSCAGKGSTCAHFQSDFFVGSPFRIAADGGQRFQDLGGGSAGITHTRTDGAIKRRMRHGFIAAEDQFVFCHILTCFRL